MKTQDRIYCATRLVLLNRTPFPEIAKAPFKTFPGAKEVLYLAKLFNVKKALLKAKSPSCGNKEIYDGTFTKNKIKGMGITARLLKENGIEIRRLCPIFAVKKI